MFFPYDPGLVVVTFKGIELTGFSEGTMVNVERDEDGFSKKTGAQGDTARVRNRNRNGSATVNLMQGSPANTLLSEIALADEVSGFGYGEFMVKDLNGATLCHAPVAWIRKIAGVALAADSENREWVFDMWNLTPLVGGSTVVL